MKTIIHLAKKIMVSIIAVSGMITGLPLFHSLPPLKPAAPAIAAEFTLKAISEDLVRDYPAITHIRSETLQAGLLKSPETYLIFDVREQDEFRVSHLRGAQHLSPGTWTSGFFKQYGHKPFKGRKIIFYCSVGVRSSKMANALREELLKRGAAGVYNLKAGLFGWANRDFAMVDKSGSTSYIHPFDQHWGQLIQSRQRWRYKPAD